MWGISQKWNRKENGVTAQEPEFRSQEPGVRMRTPAATYEDLGYGDISELMQLLEGVSKLLESYARSIPDSGFWLPEWLQNG